VFVAGNLNIAAVQDGDIQDPPLVWQCAISNPIIVVSAKGSRKKIVPSGEPTGKFLAIDRSSYRGFLHVREN